SRLVSPKATRRGLSPTPPLLRQDRVSSDAMAEAIEVHITAPDVERAAEMARTLVAEGLCACVNIVKEVRSIYVYEGRIHDEPEVLCVAKTRQELFARLEARGSGVTPYRVPA